MIFVVMNKATGMIINTIEMIIIVVAEVIMKMMRMGGLIIDILRNTEMVISMMGIRIEIIMIIVDMTGMILAILTIIGMIINIMGMIIIAIML